ncbi:non-canonical purine NTP pyrophosphatase [Roseibium porphyridii]|uniref:Non-canonical purine NTP pyrophosphatase n=1 Tax=Roseibium porphyridii TaxID=2866279 RepID=A0ABY8F2C0_9HYPH|nr:non-canonical purine NTP pyrophosphatase [Roseibium sp. KMA01]WFE88157.1 non-canonical purine NTP pyrophosphatase [Roseibium sp. KMA01]
MEDILTKIEITVIPVDYKINEIQTIDVPALVHDKCIKAFQKVSRPIFVEHTSLHISPLNGFPGGLTQVFWDTLEADKVAEIFGEMADSSVKATTRIAYCDGKKVHQFEGEILGKISSEPRGNRDFQWDCIFIPEGETQTFAEMGEKKNEISMRRKALEEFACFLEGNSR